MSLYASSDAFVSLHRSEGLGLSLVEAMSLGLPVVATGWSGNVDFMTPENSCPVDFTLAPVRADRVDYPGYRLDDPEALWADPSVDHCAEILRALADDHALRRRVGEQARRDMTALAATIDKGARVDALREACRPGSAVRRRRPGQRRRLRALFGWTPRIRALMVAGRVRRWVRGRVRPAGRATG